MRKPVILILCSLLAASILAFIFFPAWSRNVSALQTARICLGEAEPPILPRWLGWLDSREGEVAQAWFAALQVGCRDQPESETAAWIKYLSKTEQRIEIVRLHQPENLELASASVRFHPESAEAWFWLAGLSAQQGDDPKAVQAYQTGLELDPTDGLNWIKLGRLLEAQGDLSGAVQAYDQACAWVDQGKNGCPAAAGMYTRLGMHEPALQRWRDCQRQLPYWQPCMLGLAQSLVQLGRVEDARPYLEKLANQGNNQAKELLNSLGP